ncbi:hypothetical protein KEM54_004739, partial [Ascosphaera aggregata]
MAPSDTSAVATGADSSRYDLRRRNIPAVEVNDVTVLPAGDSKEFLKPKRQRVCCVGNPAMMMITMGGGGGNGRLLGNDDPALLAIF